MVSLTVGRAQDDERLNVIYLCIEDMSTFLGCYGNEMAHTSRIDRLAEESLLFEDVHCLVPLLEERGRPWKRAAVSHDACNLPFVAVKTSRHNRMRGDGNPPRLFDRKADPLNLRGIAEHCPEVVAELRR